MKSLKLFLLGSCSVAVAALLGVTSASAQTNSYDDAYHYAYASATWYGFYNTNPPVNFGFGFTPWVVATNGPGSHGFFTTRNAASPGGVLPLISSPTNTVDAPGNNNSAHVWGLFANGTGNNAAVMYRGFANSLTTNVVFKLDWECIGIGNTANNLGGFALRNGNSTNGTSDYLTGQRFAFYYVGGGANTFVYWDNNGVQAINIPFASNPLACEFTLEPNDTYRFVVKSLATGNILAILDGQPLLGSGTIDSVSLFALQTSGNQNFNFMQIVSASLVPPTIVNVQPTNGSVYIDPITQNVSFEVDSLASTVSSNTVSLFLNGVKQTNMLFNTLGGTNALRVTNNVPLAGNVLYNASIVAGDINGNKVTNNFSFNTFLQTDNFIEAEDYNFNGGSFLANAFPAANAGYAGFTGVSGIDYLDLTGTLINAYRPSDDPQALAGNDPVDHAGYAAGPYPDYYLGYTDTGEWEDYTRIFPATNYTVYARMAGFGTSPIMELERLASPTATSATQPLAAVGSFVVPATGGTANYVFVPLTDLFGNTVRVNFAGTNTLRCTAVGGSRAYNFNYLILVPNSATNAISPYLSTGSPTPNSTGVGLDRKISFTVANGTVPVNPASIRLIVKTPTSTNEVTGSLIVSNNAAGSQVSYAPPGFLAPNTAYTLTAIFADTNSVSFTNNWQFTTVNSTVTVIPASDALPLGSGTTNGFALSIYKISDSAPTTASLANAEAELAGSLIDPNTSLPYPNLASSGSYLETNTINYDITGAPSGTPTFNFKSPIPNVAAGPVNNNIALQALMYLQLNAGSYHFQVRSDDGFRFTAGPTPGNTNLVLGQFDTGRGNGTPSDIYFTVLTSGLYPMRLLYYQAGSGGNVEFYSLYNATTPILINDTTNANSIIAFAAVNAPPLPVTILNPARTGNTVTFSFLTQAAHTHYEEYKGALTDPNWTLLQTVTGNGSITNITDSSASGPSRFYHVRSQ